MTVALSRDQAPVSSPAQVVVSASNLSAKYGARTVWAGATFSIARGSFTAVLGPNGSGKSTLFKLVLGQLSPAAGELNVFGSTPRTGNPRIGYIPQGATFDPDFSVTGRDFVGLGIDGHRWGVAVGGWRQRRAMVDAAIESVEAAIYADRPLGRLSGGEQQRLLLAHSLVGRPELLLMDEPLAHLDVRNQGAIVQLLIKVIRERSLTVLLIAHDVNPLLPYIDNVFYIANGKTAMGSPAEIITSASLSAIYSAPIDVLKDRHGRIFVTGLEEEAAHPHA